MDDLQREFTYGIVGKNYFYNNNKGAIAAYQKIKKIEPSHIKRMLEKTTSIVPLNVPRIVGVLLCSHENDFSRIFNSEVKTVEQLVFFGGQSTFLPAR